MKLLLLVATTLSTSGAEFYQEEVRFQLPNGKSHQASILVPAPPPRKKIPIIYLFGGFEEAARVLSLIRPNIPVAVASFDYPFKPPRKFKFPESFRHGPEAKEAIHQTLGGIHTLHERLKSTNRFRTDQAVIVGASFGAPFAIDAAAKNPELKGLVVVHGFADVPGTLVNVIRRSWKRKIGALATPAAWLVSHLGWWYVGAKGPDTQIPLLRKEQKVLSIIAEDDTFIPPESRAQLKELLDQAPAQHDSISMPGDHLQPGAHDLVNRLIQMVGDWMKKKNLAS